ncbi:MAG: hypothetical protein AAEJ04_00260 [Planctomycetota bacterium]
MACGRWNLWSCVAADQQQQQKVALDDSAGGLESLARWHGGDLLAVIGGIERTIYQRVGL